MKYENFFDCGFLCDGIDCMFIALVWLRECMCNRLIVIKKKNCEKYYVLDIGLVCYVFCRF